MSLRHSVGVLLLGLATSHALAAQEDGAIRPGKRALLERTREIALARSAAPRDVSEKATVLVLTDSGYATAEAGTNGVHCIVSRSWPQSLEPICYDAEASLTIMPLALREAAMLQQGRDVAEIRSELDAGLRTGKYRLPRRPAMTYMMSAAQDLIADDGQRAGAWQPHLMLYYPYLSNADIGVPDAPSISRPMMVNSGGPLANVMIVMPKAVPLVQDTPSSAKP